MSEEHYHKLHEEEIKELLMLVLKDNPIKFKNGSFRVVDIELDYNISMVEVFAVLKLAKEE